MKKMMFIVAATFLISANAFSYEPDTQFFCRVLKEKAQQKKYSPQKIPTPKQFRSQWHEKKHDDRILFKESPDRLHNMTAEEELSKDYAEADKNYLKEIEKIKEQNQSIADIDQARKFFDSKGSCQFSGN